MRPPENNERGIALILVLWVMVLLVALGTEFAFSMRTEINTTRNYKEDSQSYYLARAGINLAMAEILQQVRYHSRTEETGFVFGKAAPAATEDTPQALPEEPVELITRENLHLGPGTVTYFIEDENGKINLNTASRDVLIKALALNGMEMGSERDGIADAILDWIDPDDNHRANGAESDYYESLNPGYSAKNGPFDTIDELLMVKGMTAELLYGSPDYREGEPEEGIYPGLERIFTVQNIGTFNPNTAAPSVLSLLYSDTQVNEIIQTRNDKGYYSESTSTHFRVKATGRLDHSPVRHTIVAIIEKQGTDDKATLITRYWKDNVFEEMEE